MGGPPMKLSSVKLSVLTICHPSSQRAGQAWTEAIIAAAKYFCWRNGLGACENLFSRLALRTAFGFTFGEIPLWQRELDANGLSVKLLSLLRCASQCRRYFRGISWCRPSRSSQCTFRLSQFSSIDTTGDNRGVFFAV